MGGIYSAGNTIVDENAKLNITGNIIDLREIRSRKVKKIANYSLRAIKRGSQ